MSDVRIMKTIIIHIYNILQVLWSSEVKFVSLSELLGCPLFGSNSGLFAVPGFIVSTLSVLGARTGPSVVPVVSGLCKVHSLPGASDVVLGTPEVCTLPDASDVCLEALQGAHSPWCFGFQLNAP